MKILTENELSYGINETARSAARYVADKRHEQGLTRYELAKRSGVHWVSVNKIETGKVVRFDVLSRVVKALGGSMFFI